MKILDVPQSGSLAGTTSSRNRYGQYRRARSAPVQPRTDAQLLARQRLTIASQSWRTLSANLHQAWEAFAANIQLTDSLGQPYTPTGLQAYVSLVTTDYLTGAQSILGGAPPDVANFGGNPVTAINANDTPEIMLTHGAIPADGLIAELSPPRSAGRTFEADFRFVAFKGAGPAGTWDVGPAWAAKFGSPIPGQKIFARVRMVLNGQTSAPLQLSALIESI